MAVAAAAAPGETRCSHQEGRQPDHHRGPLADVEGEQGGEHHGALLRQRLDDQLHEIDFAMALRSGHSARERHRAKRRGHGEHEPQAAPAPCAEHEGGREQRDRASRRHVGAPEAKGLGAVAGRGRGGVHQGYRGHGEEDEADALEETRGEEGGEAQRDRAQDAARRHDGKAGERQPLVAEAVAQHAGEDSDQHAHQVERGGDEARLDQRQAELGAHRRQRRAAPWSCKRRRPARRRR